MGMTMHVRRACDSTTLDCGPRAFCQCRRWGNDQTYGTVTGSLGLGRLAHLIIFCVSLCFALLQLNFQIYSSTHGTSMQTTWFPHVYSDDIYACLWRLTCRRACQSFSLFAPCRHT